MALPQTTAFGAWLATRGLLARFAIALSAVGALVSVGAAAALARRHGAGALPAIVAFAASWGSGTLLAFAAAVHALRRDRDEGLLALARARGVSARGYAWGRLSGLSLVLAVAVCGPTLVASLAATTASHGAIAVLRSSLGALAYCVSFAAVMGPVAMAALGARTRAGGYLTLLAVLVLPELLAPVTAPLLPAGWDELTSIPAALDAVRIGVQAPTRHGEALARALVGLAAVAVLSVFAVTARVREAEEAPP